VLLQRDHHIPAQLLELNQWQTVVWQIFHHEIPSLRETEDEV
jgi:hypothetical protein